ncbi:MAG: hypothetical protein WC073_11030 [Sterolibacterium sp.]
MTIPQKTCATCSNYDPSRLDGYGYCKAAPSLETLAQFLAVGSACVFDKWHARPLASK